jgi:hypothetical protein
MRNTKLSEKANSQFISMKRTNYDRYLSVVVRCCAAFYYRYAALCLCMFVCFLIFYVVFCLRSHNRSGTMKAFLYSLSVQKGASVCLQQKKLLCISCITMKRKRRRSKTTDLLCNGIYQKD